MSEKRVLYGIQGEGRGHATRSLHIIRFLREMGYKVHVFSGGDALTLLSEQRLPITEIPLFRLICNQQGKLKIGRTLWKNSLQALGLMFRLGRKYRYITSKIKRIKPDFIITDFEPYLARIAPQMGIPSIAIDHQHIFLESKLPRFKSHRKRMILFIYKLLTLILAGHPDKIISSSFYHFPAKKQTNASFVGPFIARKLYNLPVYTRNHITVYLKEPAYIQHLLPVFQQIPETRFEIFSDWSKISKLPQLTENVKFCRINQSRFLDSLATSMALITTAGNQVIGEAVFMNKPVLAFPKLNDIEQEINGIALERSGFGEMCFLNQFDFSSIKQFIKRIPTYRENIIRQKKVSEDFDGTSETLHIIESSVNEWQTRQPENVEIHQFRFKSNPSTPKIGDSVNRLINLLIEG